MSAFAAALAALAADPNLGTDALWQAGGAGAPVPVRVLRSSPDRVGTAFDAAVVRATDVLTVAIADLPHLAADDRFAIGPDLLVVTHVERDAVGVAWRASCRREP